MDAGKVGLLKFLGERQQLSIPIYQRKYSWTDEECKQLLDDILRVGGSDEETHFIGSVVYMNQKGHIASPITELMIIDGQQRITTITLLISAIVDFLLKNPNEEIIPPENLINYYLLNNMEIGEKRYKLILTQDDKKTLIKIIDSLENNEELLFNNNDSNRIKQNFEFFKKRINKNNIETLYNGLNKLLIIWVALEHNTDNPQLIFESLNSTGLELSKADLIRNYILMGLLPDEQEKLYGNYWHEIEVLFEKNDGNFDNFIRDYLTINTGRIPKTRNIYTDFKKYSKTILVDDLVKDIYKYAFYLNSIAFGDEENPKLKESFNSLSNLGYDVVYPFMLQLYNDYKENKLSVNEFCDIITYTESYLVRRLICSIPTASLRKTFSVMYSNIDDTNYLDSYKQLLLSMENYQRMPNNYEFNRNFRLRDIYNLNAKNKDYLFDKFENFGSKEKTNIKNYTIEHIMPQNPNLSKEWQKALGGNWKEIQKTYLHTIGNLTLTGYNSKYSDRPFAEKRDMENGFKDSAIRLNIDLQDLENWNEDAIKNRANEFVRKADMIWLYP